MKTDSLKIPFIASLIFHSMVLFTIAFLLPSVREAVMDITPIEILTVTPAEEKMPEPLPEKEIQKIKEEIPSKVEEKIIEEPKINKVVEAPPLPTPIEKEIIKEVTVEAPPPLIEETLTEPLQENVVAKSDEPPSNEMVLKSEAKISDLTETASLRAEGEAISAEQPKTAGSKYGVDGGTGSGNGEEMGLFRAMVRTKIERAKFYPRWARERGFEGVVGIRFVVTPEGAVEDVKIVRPCHCEILNKAACEAIMKAAPFHPKPKELEAKKMPMEIDISYRLD
jgi:protein TonB